MAWQYLDAANQPQPFQGEHLNSLIATGVIGPQTMIWEDQLPNWTPAQQVFPDHFQAVPTPPQLPPPPMAHQAPVHRPLNCKAIFRKVGLGTYFGNALLISMIGFAVWGWRSFFVGEKTNDVIALGVAITMALIAWIGATLFYTRHRRVEANCDPINARVVGVGPKGSGGLTSIIIAYEAGGQVIEKKVRAYGGYLLDPEVMIPIRVNRLKPTEVRMPYFKR